MLKVPSTRLEGRLVGSRASGLPSAGALNRSQPFVSYAWCSTEFLYLAVSTPRRRKGAFISRCVGGRDNCSGYVMRAFSMLPFFLSPGLLVLFPPSERVANRLGPSLSVSDYPRVEVNPSISSRHQLPNPTQTAKASRAANKRGLNLNPLASIV